MTIKTGMFVSFKSGVEMSGKVVAIREGRAHIECRDPYTDEPITEVVALSKCWVE